MKLRTTNLIILACLLISITLTATNKVKLPSTLLKKINIASKQGSEFLLKKQLPDGSWMQHPAITSLICTGLYRNNICKDPKINQAVNKGLDAVIKFAKKDGSIWNKQTEKYPNYSTAVSLIALATVKRPQDLQVMKNARKFLINSQFCDKTSTDGSYGGIGYGKRLRPDLSNTQWALEALHKTDYLDREPYNTNKEQAQKADLAWKRAITFLTTCQNLKQTNKEVWVMSDPENEGGFIYMPGESKAGSIKIDGVEKLPSYGSMSYSGLKSMLYANLNKDDIRVKAVMKWVGRHYDFSQNPGMKLSGHFYYLHSASRALAVYGQEIIIDKNGKKHYWRQDILEQILQMQKKDGSWSNSDGRWWESVPELATAYALIVMAESTGNAPRN